MIKILSIGSDRSIFNKNSESQQRIIEYGKLAEEMHIVVFSRRNFQFPSASWRTNFQVSENVFIYPTHSRSRWFYIYDAVRIGKKILAAGGRWLITGQDPFECGLAGWLVKKKFDIPLQLQVHTDFMSSYFKKESLLNRIRVLIAKFLIPRANCIRVVSERIKKSIISSFPGLAKRSGAGKLQASRISVLPIFVDIKKIQETPVKTAFHKKYPQFDFTILMASRLTKEKNIGLAIKAMPEIVKKYPKTGLIIIGKGPEEKKLKFQVSNFKLQENIIFESWTDDIISHYKTSDLFLLISNYEGYGRSVIEAMAAGCPAIMTDVGLAGEVLIDKKDGIVIPVEDKERLIETVINLIKNPELRKDLIENSRKTIQFWQTKENYLNAYRDSWLACSNLIR